VSSSSPSRSPKEISTMVASGSLKLSRVTTGTGTAAGGAVAVQHSRAAAATALRRGGADLLRLREREGRQRWRGGKRSQRTQRAICDATHTAGPQRGSTREKSAPDACGIRARSSRRCAEGCHRARREEHAASRENAKDGRDGRLVPSRTLPPDRWWRERCFRL
jgi:hypothetical protein